jgi:Flp pilus assembly protein TadB
MIPVPGFPQVLVSYKELLAHEKMNEPEIIIPELLKKFSVKELLDGVEDLSSRMKRRERDLDERRFPQRRPEEIQTNPQPPSLPSKNNPTSSLMSFVFGFVILLVAIVGAAIAISNWVSVTAAVMTSIIIIAALLAIGVVGAMQLRNDDRLSDDNFLKLMIESYRRLPLLRGQGEANEMLEKQED